jgi:hypothetical protein
MDAEECGRGRSLCVFRRFAIDGIAGPPGAGGTGRPGTAGAAPVGGFGAPNVGGFGAEDIGFDEDSGSER